MYDIFLCEVHFLNNLTTSPWSFVRGLFMKPQLADVFPSNSPILFENFFQLIDIRRF